jgi:hypothetical protein
MLSQFISLFQICKKICTEVTAICIFWVCVWALICQGLIYTAVLLFNIWSKYDSLAYLMMYFGCVNKYARHVYFLANLKYANKLLKHMSCGYIGACPP